MNRRPVFRFTGKPEQMKQQFQLAHFAQEVYFQINGDGSLGKVGREQRQELVELGSLLDKAGVRISSPDWFAELLGIRE